MPETDYATHCAWCHADLSAGFIEGFPAFGTPAFNFAPEANRYCSERCIKARIDDLFGRQRDVGEKWVRYSVEVPPEVAALLDKIVKLQLGVNASAFSRANVTRRALKELLQRILVIPEPGIPATAEDVIDRPVIEARTA